MITFRTDKEVMQIMGNCVDFVCELIDYIAEYPDDDYMTMECLCRKLVKYDLIDKKDGYYLVDKGIKVAEQTEPQTDNGIGCSKCESRFWCMDRDMPHAVHCNNYGKTEPSTDCSWK